MNSAELRRLRTQSILKELLPEAFCALDDNLLKTLSVTDVQCSRGRYDAFVYLDKTPFDEHEQSYILSHLAKAQKILQNYCMCEQGWFKCPKFHFKFDDALEYQNKMDALFEKISQDLKHDD